MLNLPPSPLPFLQLQLELLRDCSYDVHSRGDALFSHASMRVCALTSMHTQIESSIDPSERRHRTHCHTVAHSHCVLLDCASRYCCRRMVLTHVDLIQKLIEYAPLEK
jgi:hypothetical protein